MPPPLSRLFAPTVVGALMLGVALTEAPARPQPPGANPQPGDVNPDGSEVLARGPVHEAFAATVEQPTPGEVVTKAPPEPVEELPPDQKPEGDSVQWIPGYWDWDDERADFIWVSGFWRVPPPGRVWVPGSWTQVPNGFQWTHGFWQNTVVEQPGAQPVQPEIEYLPPPPAPIEAGPTVPAPGQTSVYVTGSWMWRGRYVWRPGFWMGFRPGWVWVPAHYRWTPLGHIFVDGYWDYPLATRGVLFTPVYFPRPVLARPRFVYTPTYVVAEPVLFGALFVRRGYGSYYFGDYYDARYARGGYQPWCAPALRGNVAVAGVPARGWSYDPLWSYYSVSQRQNPRWNTQVTELYVGRYQGTVPRPPRTLVQQNQVIQKITNVNNITNNFTVVNNNITVNNTNVNNNVMIAPLASARNLQPQTKIQPITAQVRQQEARHATELRQVAVNRQRAEVQALRNRPAAPAQPATPPKAGTPPTPPPAAQPVRLKLDVPKEVTARARVRDERNAPPPPPTQARIDPKVEPKTPAPKFEPKVPTPKVDPKTPTPKVEPKTPAPKAEPKVDPKMPAPKVEPKVNPKVEPKFPTPVPMPTPKVEPKQPPANPLPKVEPKVPNPTPAPTPKVEPKVPTPPPVQPKVQPKLPNATPNTPAQPTPLPVQPKLPNPVPQPTPPMPKLPNPVPLPTPTPQPTPPAPKVPNPTPLPNPPMPKLPNPTPVPTPPAPKLPNPVPLPSPAPKLPGPAPIPNQPQPGAPRPKVEPKQQPQQPGGGRKERPGERTDERN